MDNSESAPLSYEETLMRLYQLKYQLSIDDALALESLETASDGFCDDCHAVGFRYVYGSVLCCERCCCARMTAARYHAAQEAGLTS